MSTPGSKRAPADRRLAIEDSHGRTVEDLADAGLVAAVRDGEDQPTWVVTGTDDAATAAAASLLGPGELEDRYAVAVSGGESRPVPAADSEGAQPSEECR